MVSEADNFCEGTISVSSFNIVIVKISGSQGGYGKRLLSISTSFVVMFFRFFETFLNIFLSLMRQCSKPDQLDNLYIKHFFLEHLRDRRGT